MAMGSNGVKVTYIETQFVTSDAAGFKSLVQRLTGKSGAEAADAPRSTAAPLPRRRSRRTSAVSGAPSHLTSAAAEARLPLVRLRTMCGQRRSLPTPAITRAAGALGLLGAVLRERAAQCRWLQ
ncbi:hypothetical protein ZWY2020_037006 [Hordeum vulgare]|nr:hypothetical protein ZWY2020_037006 [Hordeum vulgare]